MSLRIIVLAKQVPDTRNVGKDAMTPEGTVNRSALPAIFNPEDLNALEQALQLKEQNPGTTISLLTMGPPRASEIYPRRPFQRSRRRSFVDRPGFCRSRHTGNILCSCLCSKSNGQIRPHIGRSSSYRRRHGTSGSPSCRKTQYRPSNLR